MQQQEYVKALYGDVVPAPCPFTQEEIAELKETNELLIYLPKGLTPQEMCQRWDIPCNIDFKGERLIRTVMTTEDQWFLASAEERPELLYVSGQQAARIYQDEGLHGMDLRRYLAFAATFRLHFGRLPDQAYWTFLHSGSYDRSGISVAGFDRHGCLNHHGWMRNFKAKFAGSRYVVLAPRIEVVKETADIPRARRGQPGWRSLEASMDS